MSGVETCNCRTTDTLFKDTHIELIPSKSYPGASKNGKNRQVIVEVTPRFRLIRAQDGVDWTTDTLRQSIKGHYVRVKGWMFDDREHRCTAQNTRKAAKPDCHGRDGTVWQATTGNSSADEHRDPAGKAAELIRRTNLRGTRADAP